MKKSVPQFERLCQRTKVTILVGIDRMKIMIIVSTYQRAKIKVLVDP
jgi:hypothetical protein